MATTTEIPVVIHADAAARVAQLCMQQHLEQMIEHTKQTVTELERVEVEAWDEEYDPGQAHVCLIAWRHGPSRSSLDASDAWNDWFIQSFPADVARWFSLDFCYRG